MATENEDKFSKFERYAIRITATILLLLVLGKLVWLEVNSVQKEMAKPSVAEKVSDPTAQKNLETPTVNEKKIDQRIKEKAN